MAMGLTIQPHYCFRLATIRELLQFMDTRAF
jgi:hypothetical protein